MNLFNHDSPRQNHFSDRINSHQFSDGTLDNLLDLLLELQLIEVEKTATNTSTKIELQNGHLHKLSSESLNSNLFEAEINLTNQAEQSSLGSESTNHLEDEQSEKLLQNLLAELIMGGDRYPFKKLERKLKKIETDLYQPQELINLILPLIAEILSRKIAESQDEVIDAIVPIIDQVISEKTQQDKIAMIKAIASIIPGAISKQISESPDELIQALAPAMGKSIKEQIRLERDAMVDALYPVIGNTIAKYMTEVVNEINQKVENTLSFEGVKRKVSAKMQGISEAELILRESMSFRVQAVFLIHKASGLVITESQKIGEENLESDMLAGMLTAIRSFASECIIKPGNVSELTEIEYENFKIVMEVAGYCYLTVILEGDPTQEFLKLVRKILSNIILNYDINNCIEDFNGDPDSIPDQVSQQLELLIEYHPESQKKPPHKPWALLLLIVTIISIISIPWGWWIYRQQQLAKLKNNVMSALSATPELAVYNLGVKIKQKDLILTGKLPNPRLRQQAAEIAARSIPNLHINNQIIAVQVPPEPLLIAAEIERLTNLFNQINGVLITTKYDHNHITVSGYIPPSQDSSKISQAFAKIPGIEKVAITLLAQPLPTQKRIYFASNSANLEANEMQQKLIPIQQLLQQHPKMQLKIIGHSDYSGINRKNKQLAKQRAEAVKQALITQGIDSQRLITESSGQPPIDVQSNQPLWLGRCVQFEPILPN